MLVVLLVFCWQFWTIVTVREIERVVGPASLAVDHVDKVLGQAMEWQ
jgi:hypothetical protein